MLRLKDKIEASVTYADRAGSATMADSASAVAWGNVSGKPSTFPPSSHTHSKSDVGLGNVDNTADSAKSVKYATTAGSANAVAWGNVSGKPSTFPPASHTHTKSQITDFPTSLKNPTALTVQTNGTTAATYDGSAAKTVNITKSSIGLGNVDNTADSAKSVNYAASAGAVAWANVSGKPSTFTPASHTHSKSDVGLGNVDNTADSAKSVSYATSAGSASKLGSATVGSASTPIYLNGGTATACTGVMKAPIYSTTDLTAGSSDLATGQLYLVYE